ncbi:MAG: hypothetical protein ACRC46_08080 [Thermoguttaceae bacterium]
MTHTHFLRSGLRLLCVVVVAVAVGFVAAAERDAETNAALRITCREGKKTPQTLETAIISFTSPDKTQRVDFIAAVHIGDKRYYEELNRRFKEYDAVLYELVAEEGTVLDQESLRERKGSSLLGSFQGTLSSSLGLEGQLEHIDYTAKNFVHADLPPDEFFRLFQQRGDMTKMLMRAFVSGMSDESQQNELAMQGRLIGALLLRDKTLALKRTFSSILVQQLTTGMWILDGGGSAIITDRNEACLKVLRRELDAGKRHIAIFYGGGHFAAMADVLSKDFGLVYSGCEWVVAWDMRTAPKPVPKDNP